MSSQASAIEVAVHGWDIFRTCNQHQPIPSALATDLLKVSRLAAPAAGRYPLFAPPIAVSRLASPSDRLVAFLGRGPHDPTPPTEAVGQRIDVALTAQEASVRARRGW
jgi:hypothetical protein